MDDKIPKCVITFVMKNNGKQEILESEFYLTLSMTLQWCSPHLAKQFIQRALQDKLLIKKKGLLSSSFSLIDVSIPVGFKTTNEFFQNYKPKQSSLDVVIKPDLLSHITSNTSFSDNEIQTKIKSIMMEKQVSVNIALLLFGKKHGISIDSYMVSVEEDLFIENTEGLG